MNIGAEALCRVRAIARSVRAGFPTDEALFDDLVSEGLVGLVEAGGRFDPSRSGTFWTFAFPRVKGRVIDSLRREAKQGGALALREVTTVSAVPSSRPSERPAAVTCTAARSSSSAPAARSMESQLTQRTAARLMGELLGELEPTERRLVAETVMMRQPMAEVAREMNLDRRKAARVVARVLSRMRRRMLLEGYRLEDFV